MDGLSEQTVNAAAAAMAARFLITRILLVLLLSELDYSSAFPRAWQSEMKKDGHDYGNRRPLQYVRSLRQPHQNLRPNVHDQVQVRTWQRPKAQIQNQPRMYHQTQSPHQPWSDVATTGTQEVSPSQHPSQRDYPLIRPRSFEFNLKIPFAHFLGQKKETSSTTKGSDLSSGGSDGAGHGSQLYRPTSVQINSVFSSASGSDDLSGKGSTNDPIGGKSAQEVSKPSFLLSLSVPIPPTNPSPKPASSHGDHLANLKRPESVGFVQNSYMEPAEPQPSSTQSGSERIFSNFASAVQQQTQHQMFEPVQTKYTDSTQMTFLPGHASQHTTPISQVKIPAKQSLVFPEPSAPSLPNSQYPPLQSDNVNSGYYSAQINPLSNDYGKAQSGQTVSSDQTNVHLSLFPSQYERVQSSQYGAGQVKPSGNNYGQSQIWQPVSAPPTFASEQCNDGQFKPSFGQNAETTPYLSPVYPSSPTVVPSQYELPSSHQVATNYYGTGNVAQMVPTDFSSSSYYQDNIYQSGQEALPDHVTAPSPNFQSLSTDYQTQMRLPGQYTNRGQLNGKPKYTQLFIDDDDVMYQYASNPHY